MELEKLRKEKEKANQELHAAQAQLKALDREAAQLERKARTSRLIHRGLILEGFLQKPLLLTDDQVEMVLKVAFHPRAVGDILERFLRENEEKRNDEEYAGESRRN